MQFIPEVFGAVHTASIGRDNDRVGHVFNAGVECVYKGMGAVLGTTPVCKQYIAEHCSPARDHDAAVYLKYCTPT